MSARSKFARLPTAIVAMTVVAAISPWLASVPEAAASTGSLHSLACTQLPTDPPLEAPQYAQTEGASGGTDAWWCQMPHATELPTHFVELSRGVAPLTFPYSLYMTDYGVEAKGGVTASIGTNIPGIRLTIDFNSTVDHAPGKLTYPKAPHGRKVTISKGVTGTLVKASNDTEVVWRFPTKGVPRYLQGVATVTVTGTKLPAATVLKVAQHVAPD
jgi:hypothetical protein